MPDKIKIMDNKSITLHLSESLANYLEGSFYFPSRVKYLEDITKTIKNIDKKRTYVYFALNSTVSSQLILNSQDNRFNFLPYFNEFRQRQISNDDLVFRIFCFPETQRMSFNEKIGDIKSAVERFNCRECMNTYLDSQEAFNCVYIAPLKKNADTREFRKRYDCLVKNNDDKNGWRELVDHVYELIDIDLAIVYREILDYDSTDSHGCGYKTYYKYQPDKVREKFAAYVNLFKKSHPLFCRPELKNIDRFDLGIIVALGVELQAIEKQVGSQNLKFWRTVNGVNLYQARFNSKAKKGDYHILVALLPEPGNIASSIATTLLINTYDIKNIINLGIAGGLRGEINLGDVFVARKVIYYEKKKLIESGTAKPQHCTYDANFGEIALHHKKDQFLERMPDNYSSIHSAENENHKPSAHYDCEVASGEKVVGDPELMTTIRNDVSRKVVAVENEAAGLYSTATKFGNGIRFVTIKGISDYADSEKADGLHELASAVSAAYAFYFLDNESI